MDLFPEHCTLQMNSNCLARYQHNKLKRSKAHSPTAALKRCHITGLSAQGENGQHCPWPWGQFVLGLQSPASHTDCPLSCPCGEALGAPDREQAQGAAVPSLSHHPHPKSFLPYAYSGIYISTLF